ncbi:O-acetyltransferase dmxR13 [Exophiala dermatitidis]
MSRTIPQYARSFLDNFPLDVFGQQPGLYNLYTQICLCYPVDDPDLSSFIIRRLKSGLERLTANFPWVAGQVVNSNGTYKIVPFERTPRLVVRDYRDNPDIPPMDVLQVTGFPMDMLDEIVICPIRTLAAKTAAPNDPAPVFMVQANLIDEGLVLSFVAQHNVMDMTGLARIMRLLSKDCHGEPYTHELIWGNRNRESVIPLLEEPFDPWTELSRQLVRAPGAPVEEPPGPVPTAAATATTVPLPGGTPKCSWASWNFSRDSLEALKALGTWTMDPQIDFISTDDALSAFIWQSIMRARLPRLNPKQKVTFARAVDPRRFLGIPDSYMGVVQNMTYHTYPLDELLQMPLGSVASNLRAAIDPKTSTVERNTRALATFLKQRPEDRHLVSVTATLDLGSDIMLSSWAKEKLYELDFNLGVGNPEAVRRPAFDPVESLIYLMPKALNGEISAAICLRDEDLDRLRADEQFKKYARYVC